jgi:hypothetical protein
MTTIRKRVLLVALLLVAGMTFWLSCGDDNSSEPEPCYTLTISTDGFGSVEVTPDSACYHAGTVVNVTAVAGESWLFDSWDSNVDLGGAENDEAIQITVGAANIALTANFIQGYSVTLFVDPENTGTVEVDPDQAYFAPGTIVTLTPVAEVGYIFANWSILGDDAVYTDDPLELTIGTSNLVVTATFYNFEGEPDCGTDYVDEFNGGCNSDPPVFGTIESGAIYYGTSGTYLFEGSQYRDTDWYEYEATGDELLVFTGVAEFPVQMAIIDGNGGCGSYTVLDIDQAAEGDTLAVSYVVSAGTYWMWVGPSVFTGWDCPLGYVAWLEAQPTALSNPAEPKDVDAQMLSNEQR